MPLKRVTIKPASKPDALVDVRGPSGRLYGRLNPETLIIEVKAGGKPAERIDLRPYLRAAKID